VSNASLAHSDTICQPGLLLVPDDFCPLPVPQFSGFSWALRTSECFRKYAYSCEGSRTLRIPLGPVTSVNCPSIERIGHELAFEGDRSSGGLSSCGKSNMTRSKRNTFSSRSNLLR